jgi:hypothetical protein
MTLTIIIFFVSIITAFTMLAFRAWELRTGKVQIPGSQEPAMPDFAFRHVEKNMLYLTKHIVQVIILTCAKYWFIFTTRTKKWISEKWPKIHARFEKKPETEKTETSFVGRAIIESRMKIKRMKERVKKEHGPEEKTESPVAEEKKNVSF